MGIVSFLSRSTERGECWSDRHFALARRVLAEGREAKQVTQWVAIDSDY